MEVGCLAHVPRRHEWAKEGGDRRRPAGGGGGVDERAPPEPSVGWAALRKPLRDTATAMAEQNASHKSGMAKRTERCSIFLAANAPSRQVPGCRPSNRWHDAMREVGEGGNQIEKKKYKGVTKPCLLIPISDRPRARVSVPLAGKALADAHQAGTRGYAATVQDETSRGLCALLPLHTTPSRHRPLPLLSEAEQAMGIWEGACPTAAFSEGAYCVPATEWKPVQVRG